MKKLLFRDNHTDQLFASSEELIDKSKMINEEAQLLSQKLQSLDEQSHRLIQQFRESVNIEHRENYRRFTKIP